MFDLSPGKILVLVLAALFVLGPERLPAAASWLGGAIRKAKAFAASANAQITSELGPELDHLRAPLAELRAPLQELRGLRDPRSAVLRHLLAGDPPAAHAAAAADVSGATTRTGAVPVIDHEAT